MINQNVLASLGPTSRKRYDLLSRDQRSHVQKLFVRWAEQKRDQGARKKALEYYLTSQFNTKTKRNEISEKSDVVQINELSSSTSTKEELTSLNIKKQKEFIMSLHEKNLDNISNPVSKKRFLVTYNLDVLLVTALKNLSTSKVTKSEIIELALENLLGEEYLNSLKETYDILTNEN